MRPGVGRATQTSWTTECRSNPGVVASRSFAVVVEHAALKWMRSTWESLPALAEVAGREMTKVNSTLPRSQFA